MQSGGPVPRPSYLPFPAWMETKNRLAAHLEDERKSYGEKSREWEEKEQVHISQTPLICFCLSTIDRRNSHCMYMITSSFLLLNTGAGAHAAHRCFEA
jgi:hypothetical protein